MPISLSSTQPFGSIVRLVVDASYNEFGNLAYGIATKQALGSLRFITSPQPIPYLSSIKTFAGGGLGINSLDPDGDNLLWFLSPYTSPTNDTSSLGLYCKAANSLPVLVHNFVVDLATLPGLGQAPPVLASGFGTFQFETNGGIYDTDGFENPPHLKPVWTLSDGALGIATHDQSVNGTAEWFLAPYSETIAPSTVRTSLGIYYKTSASVCHLVHNFTVDV
jgi:hypothetical protein